MKIAAIDIGSNSVRLMMWADGKTLYKRMKTTRLGEGLNFAPRLLEDACVRTAEAVAEFASAALSDGADKVYAFATAAVRSAENPELFTDKVKELCGIEVDVISGEQEAQIGLLGALGNGDGGQCDCGGQCDRGGIIDVGGASTEVTVRVGGAVQYSKSVNIGTVRILDAAGRDLNKINAFIAGRIAEYGQKDFSDTEMYAVGGTATRLAAIKQGIREYNAELLHGTVLTVREVENFSKLLTRMSVDEIRQTTICTKSADLIGGGAALLAAVMKNFKIKKITVSESDNLEGYVLSKL
ncbi:MAG: hypothetical protein K2K04_04620 [Clostridia bacterium]|nr:hypothetical protein [Clostridia bacterium]